MEYTERTFWDRIGVAAVVVLRAAFIITATGPLVSLVTGQDSVSGVRDDGIPFAAVNGKPRGRRSGAARAAAS